MADPEFYTPCQVAERLNVSRKLVQSMARLRQIPALILPNREVRIPVLEFNAWLRSNIHGAVQQ